MDRRAAPRFATENGGETNPYKQIPCGAHDIVLYSPVKVANAGGVTKDKNPVGFRLTPRRYVAGLGINAAASAWAGRRSPR